MSYCHELEREYAELKNQLSVTEKALETLTEELEELQAVNNLLENMLSKKNDEYRELENDVDGILKTCEGMEQELSMCENMKLAHEFEELLQTTSIPVAVEKVKGMTAVVDAAKEVRNKYINCLSESFNCNHVCNECNNDYEGEINLMAHVIASMEYAFTVPEGGKQPHDPK